MRLEALVFVVLTSLVAFFAWLAWYYRSRVAQLRNQQEEFHREREAALALINRIGVTINTTVDLEGALHTITEYIVDTIEAEAGAIYLLDTESQTLQAKALVGLFPPLHQPDSAPTGNIKHLAERARTEKIEVGQGLVGFVARTGEPLLISDARTDPRAGDLANNLIPVRSFIAAPLRLRQKVLGVFAVVNKRDQTSLTREGLRLVQLLADQAALAVDVVRLYETRAEQQRLEQELDLAREFQKMLLPTQFPHVTGLDIAAFSQPALEVGGDAYDFVWVDENHLGIAIADVSGKGIPGALVMAIMRSTLRAEAQHELSPKEVLRRVNRRLLSDTKDNVFVTMTYGILDVATKRFKFVRAGHEPLITIHSSGSQPDLHTPRGIAVGLVGDEMFDILEECEIDLANGDSFILYTDGVVEAMNPENAQYGSERFLSRLQMAHGETPNDQIRRVLADINEFTEGLAQHDDITMVSLKADSNGSGADETETAETGETV